MYATDFKYDNVSLSSYGFVICQFEDSGGLKDIEAGSPLTFKTVSRRKGNHYSLVDVSYDSALEITFDICKDPCENSGSDMFLTDEEFFDLSRWLLRKEFCLLEFVGDIPDVHDYKRYYIGGFNITKLTIDDKLAGLRLIFTANKPYAYGDTVTATLTINSASGTATLTDNSYYTGITTPNLQVTLRAAGNLTLTNSATGSITKVNNCSNNEVLTFDGENLIVTSSSSGHDIANDFNYEFLKMQNTTSSRTNTIQSSLPCTIVVTYKPIIRDAP